MTESQTVSLLIENERDVSNVRNVARMSARILSFPITDQARIGWAVANIARLILLLGVHDTLSIAHIHQDGRWGIEVICQGAWLQMVRQDWIERKILTDVSKWVDQVQFVDGNPQRLVINLWPAENEFEVRRSS